MCPVNVPDCCTQPVPSTRRIMCPAQYITQHNELHTTAHQSTTIIQSSKACSTTAHHSSTIIQPCKACSTTDQQQTFFPPRWASKWPGKLEKPGSGTKAQGILVWHKKVSPKGSHYVRKFVYVRTLLKLPYPTPHSEGAGYHNFLYFLSITKILKVCVIQKPTHHKKPNCLTIWMVI